MKILLCSTEKVDIAAQDVALVVNSLQFFFVLKSRPTPVVFGETLRHAVIIEPAQLADCATQQLAEDHDARAADFVILVTSARVAIGGQNKDFVASDKTIIISTHDWSEKDRAVVLRIASLVLHIGCQRFVKHKSEVQSCIAASGSEFDCLCYDCDEQLKSRGFRDAIIRLRDGFNILNQLAGGARGDILPPPSSLLGQRLRLGTAYAEELRASISLGHMSVMLVLHFLSDLVPFVNALTTIGIRASNIYLIAKPYPYARRDEVSHVLQTLGVNVYRASKAHTIEERVRQVLDELGRRQFSAEEKLLIIEDGGYFVPAIHEPTFESLRTRCVGAVEQTTKGAREDEKVKPLTFAVLNVGESDFKKIYESPEIGRVVVQNISRFTPDIKLSAGNALVVGFGSVGREVAFHLTNAFNMGVSVVEEKELRLLEAKHRKSIVAEAASSFAELEFKGPRLVVGTTGRPSITRAILEGLEKDAVVVSTSSDQVEVDLKALDDLAGGQSLELEEGKRIFKIPGPRGEKEITLLAEGYPINFYGSESVPNDTIDPVMTLLFLCGIELATKNLVPGLQDKPVDEIVEQRELLKRFLQLA